MIESVEMAKQMVEYGKFKPVGNRGFVGGSRGMRYGLDAPVPTMERANRETHLFVQIETMLGVERCRDIFSVDGIAGVVVGPADLSISFGKPLAFDDPEYLKVYSHVIRTCRSLGKLVVIPSGSNASLIKTGLEAGAQVFVTHGERAALKAAWAQNLKDVRALIAGA
jgi:2-keto-3-deoxy-L-rhamnonate aldolase RhmA